MHKNRSKCTTSIIGAGLTDKNRQFETCILAFNISVWFCISFYAT